MRILNKATINLILSLLDAVGEREECKTYLGHGDFEIDRGYRLQNGKWISVEDLLTELAK